MTLVLILGAFLQLIIISYNHFTGFYVNDTTVQFVLRWLIATVITAVFVFLVIFPDVKAILYLNQKLPWQSKAVARLIVEGCFSVCIAVVVSSLATLSSHLIGPYADGLVTNLVNNSLIGIVLNTIFIISLEAWIFFKDSYTSKLKAEQLERELSQIRFEVLKNQLNPHFLFNSLNVLSGLIARDQNKAQQFIDEFAMIYRYVLETIEQKVVTVNDELEFLQSYIFLQQLRYGSGLSFNLKISAKVLKHYLPPLSLQIVVENAIKHNVITEQHPLQIDIFDKDENLIIRNSMKRKVTGAASTGIGQQNLVKRYSGLGGIIPTFDVVNNDYVVELPLLKSE